MHILYIYIPNCSINRVQNLNKGCASAQMLQYYKFWSSKMLMDQKAFHAWNTKYGFRSKSICIEEKFKIKQHFHIVSHDSAPPFCRTPSPKCAFSPNYHQVWKKSSSTWSPPYENFVVKLKQRCLHFSIKWNIQELEGREKG